MVVFDPHLFMVSLVMKLLHMILQHFIEMTTIFLIRNAQNLEMTLIQHLFAKYPLEGLCSDLESCPKSITHKILFLSLQLWCYNS